jgi:hypothetical protein
MKSVNGFAAIMLLFSSIIFIHCSPDTEYINTPQEIITRGNWMVDYYFKDGDKTALYGSSQFTFNNDGTVSCTDSAQTCSGSWKIVYNVKGEDQLTMQLATQEAHLQELNVFWNITEKNRTIINLKNASAQSNTQLRLRKM